MLTIPDMTGKIRQGLSLTRSFVSGLFALPHARMYLVAAVTLSLVTAFFMFPYELVLYHAAKDSFRGRYRHLHLDSISSSWPGYVSGKGFDLYLTSGSQLKINTFYLDHPVSPFSLLGREGNINLSLDRLSVVTNTLSFRGNLSANLQGDFSHESPEFQLIKIVADRCYVKIGALKDLPLPLGEIVSNRTLYFSALSFSGKLVGGRLEIEKLALSGNDLKGDIKGMVRDMNGTGPGTVDVMIQIDKSSRILVDYMKILGDTIKGSYISIKVTGTLAKPVVKIMNMVQETNR